MENLQGTSVVVTGASSGIGRAIAQRLVADGALVTLGSRSDAGIDGADWLATDVRSPAGCEALINAAITAHGRVDVLVNNAGVQVEKTIDQTTDDEFDLVMDVNVRGVFNCCRAAVPHMKAQGSGSIINIGSVAGNVADHGLAVYNASKGAVHALTRSVATDHGRDGIRCNAVSPGWILTEMADAAFAASDDPKAARAEAVSAHPVGRMGTPDDIANLVAWLASDQAAFVSGSLFTIDGGLTAQNPIGSATHG